MATQVNAANMADTLSITESVIKKEDNSKELTIYGDAVRNGSPKGAKLSRARIFRFAKPFKDFGMRAESNAFFDNKRNTNDPNGPSNWVDYALPSLPENKRNKFNRFAVLTFQDTDNSELFNHVPTYKISHIKIQSPILLKEIRAKTARSIFNPQDVKFSLNHAEIRAPLKPLFFGREWLLRRQAEAENEEEEVQDHLAVLHDVMEHQLGEIVEQTERLQETNEITFDLLWTIFPKGTLVRNWQYSTFCGYRVCCTKLENNQGMDHLWIHCHYVAFDGREFGYDEIKFQIPRFHGPQKIDSLPVYPYSYEAEPDSRYQQFVARGKRILDMQSIRFMQASGHAFRLKRRPFGSYWEIEGSFDVSSRVVIDSFTFAKQHQKARQQIKHFETTDELQSHDVQQDVLQLPSTRASGARQNEVKELLLKDQDKLFMIHPFIDGFSLKEKIWLTFCVESLSEVDYNVGAFEQLVMQPKHKKLILSLAESHPEWREIQTDYISGKGQGLDILLSGPPGTGKTLTAEAIADKLQKPLYHIDTHELGGSVSTVSSRLRDIMKLATEWNAIVLLDEADVYLQKRSLTELTRNEIVATFLRELEYYQGILFLTTNLFDTIDEAIQSRMHVHIQFQRLQESARKTIWRNLLGYVHQSDHGYLSEEDMTQLAAWDLNGRQIKNVLRMAHQSCHHRDAFLTLEEIQDTIAVTCPLATKSGVHQAKGVRKNDADNLIDMEELA